MTERFLTHDCVQSGFEMTLLTEYAIIHSMKRAVYFFVIMLLLTFGIIKSVFVFAQDDLGGNKTEIDQLNTQIAQKKQKIAELEKSIEEYKSKIKQKQLEAVSLNNQMAIVSNRISEVSLDIKATEQKIESLILEIDTLKLEIRDKEQVIERQKRILGGLLRNLYIQNDRNYLEIAAAYESFSDFYNRIQQLETLNVSLGSSVKAITEARNDLDVKKQKIEENKLSHQKLNESLELKKRGLDEQLYLKQSLLHQTQNSEKKFNTLLGSIRSQYQSIESDITMAEQEVRRRLAEQDKLEALDEQSGLLYWPTTSHFITCSFHDPEYPYRYVFEHTGIDIKSSQGTPVRAAASGYVGRAKFCSLASCYAYVMLLHADGLATVYGHLSVINVQEEQFVTRGDVIGYSGGRPGTVGAGPFVTGPHLHFEVRKNGIPVDPAGYLN